MIRFILPLIILFSILSNAQSSYQNVDIEMQKVFIDFKNFSLKMISNYDFKSDYKFGSGNEDFIRKLDFGYFHKKVNFSIVSSDTQKSSCDYNIDLVIKNDSIIAFFNLDYYDKNPVVFYNEDKLNRYVNLHNKFYNSNSTLKDFIKSFKHQGNETRYGFACGFSPIIDDVPSYNDIYFDQIKKRKTFLEWLKSYDLGLQTYGVTAIEYLKQNQKIILTIEETKIISNIKTRNSEILVCGGCTSNYQKVFILKK